MASVENLAQLTAYRSDMLSRSRQHSVASEMQVNRSDDQVKTVDSPDSEDGRAPVEDGKGQLLDMYA